MKTKLSLSTIKTYILLGLFFVAFIHPIVAVTKTSTPMPNYNFIYSDAKSFEVLGQMPGITNYARLPNSAQGKVRQEIWDLAQQSAGISIKFKTNSPVIRVKWATILNASMPHMALTGVRGVDLYCNVNKKWEYVGTGKPSSSISDVLIAENMDSTYKEFILNLPLYDGVSDVEIAITENFTIAKPDVKISEAPSIVIYGTSITQGASSSRPGMAFTSLLARSLNKNVINLGFSGNGKFEKALAEFILLAKPALIILDCAANSTYDEIKKNLPELVAAIREQDKTTPILFMETIIREHGYFDKELMKIVRSQNRGLKEVFDDLKQQKVTNMQYLSSENFLGDDHEGTIDGTHPNDLGQYRIYVELKKKVKKILK